MLRAFLQYQIKIYIGIEKNNFNSLIKKNTITISSLFVL